MKASLVVIVSLSVSSASYIEPSRQTEAVQASLQAIHEPSFHFKEDRSRTLNEPSDPVFHNLNHGICSPRNATVAHLNRGKPVINVNSVNDDAKPWPLFDAISKGFRAVETGIWLLDTQEYGTESPLYLGRNNLYLSQEATLDRVYFDPLIKLVDEVNCKDHPVGESACDFNGVFYDSPDETLYVYLEMHSEPSSTYSVLMSQLQGLITSEYLTYFDFEKNEVVKGPITIILTGSQIPYEEIVAEEDKPFYGDNKRYVFVDAPLELLAEELHLDYSKLSVTSGASLECLTGSGGFGGAEGGLSQSQIDAIKSKTEAAHNLGLLSRVYNLPEYPQQAKQKMWSQLLGAGVDVLNGLDSEQAYGF